MKTKPRAKAKAKRQSQEELVEHQLDVFRRATAARYKLAMQAFDAQDEITKDVLNLMVERLRTLSTGQLRIFPYGKMGPSVVVPIEPALQDQNVLFLATEILKDLALYDVRVANYEFPKMYCAECGEKITLTSREKKGRRRE